MSAYQAKIVETNDLQIHYSSNKQENRNEISIDNIVHHSKSENDSPSQAPKF